jgi:hypothetical protein
VHCHNRPPLPRAREQGQPRLEVADVFRLHGEAYRQTHALSTQRRKVMRAIETCRTAALGGHLEVCPQCGDARPAYNSCRDRHCPKCQALRQSQWIEERQRRILPTHHFHVVFTIPEQLKPLARRNRARFFSLLFESAANTLLELGADRKRLGAQLGITAVLHTWTRDLKFHPHIHCVVTGGGLNPDGDRWIAARRRYLFPAKVLSRLFRGKLLSAIERARRHGELHSPELTDPKAFARFKDTLYQKKWVAYAKAPFGGASQVFNYLGRYTHRVALSNHRLLSINPEGICFVTRGRRTATLAPEQFIDRFLQHVLPERFVKIRHFGLLAAGNVNSRLEIARRLLSPERKPIPPLVIALLALFAAVRPPSPPAIASWRQRLFLLTGIDPLRCPVCGAIKLRLPLPRSPILDSS